MTLSDSSRKKAAMAVAMAADFLQVTLFPFFGMGAAFPGDDVLDVAVAVVLTWLLGWHWAFLPTLFVELVPGMDLAPTWTLATALVIRHRNASQVIEVPPSGTRA